MENETLLFTTVVKLQSLFQDPEKVTGSRALCKKVRPVSEIQQLQPTAQQYKEGHIPSKLQLENKETLISFENALQVKNFDLVKKYLEDRVKSFQGETLKFYLKQ